MPSVANLPIVATTFDDSDQLGAAVSLREGDAYTQVITIYNDPEPPTAATKLNITGWSATCEIEYYTADVEVTDAEVRFSEYEKMSKANLELPVTVSAADSTLSWRVSEAVSANLDPPLGEPARLPVAVAYIRRTLGSNARTIMILHYIIRRSVYP